MRFAGLNCALSYDFRASFACFRFVVIIRADKAVIGEVKAAKVTIVAAN